MRADRVELELLVLAVEHAAEHQRERDQALARMIISELAAALKRK